MLNYKGFDIPNTKEEILNTTTNLDLLEQFKTISIRLPYLTYNNKKIGISINTMIPIEDIVNCKDEDSMNKIIDQYTYIIKSYIDQWLERNTLD